MARNIVNNKNKTRTMGSFSFKMVKWDEVGLYNARNKKKER